MAKRKAKGRRGNNEGSITYRPAKGLFEGRVTVGYDKEDKPIRRSIYGKTQEEVRAKVIELLDKSHKGLLAEPSQITVSEYAKVYLSQATEGKAANTVRNYTQELSYALGYIGRMRLQAVKPNHILGMVQRMKEEGWKPQPTKANPDPAPRPYSARNIKKVLVRLKAMFAQALRHELIYKNPCDAVQAPKQATEPKGRTLEANELKVLLQALKNHPMETFFRLLLDTGLRKGEALALTWADIDLTSTPAKLSVNKSWSSNRLTTPKTRKSKRTVPISPSTAQALKELRATAVKTYGAGVLTAFVFGNPITGKPWEVSSPNHALTRLCTALKLKPIRVHDLRHTFGSVALSQGAKLEVVSELLGHANPTVTLNIYRHLLEEERKQPLLDLTAMYGAQPLDPEKSKAIKRLKAAQPKAAPAQPKAAPAQPKAAPAQQKPSQKRVLN